MEYGHKGKGTLIHLLVDCRGSPIAASTTGAAGDERKQVNLLIDKSPIENWIKRNDRMSILEADKGYDSSSLRQKLLNRKILPVIPWRKNNREKVPMEIVCQTFGVNRKRWVVERSIAWIKRKCRRLLMRWERKSNAWDAFVQLALIFFWLKFY